MSLKLAFFVMAVILYCALDTVAQVTLPTPPSCLKNLAEWT